MVLTAGEKILDRIPRDPVRIIDQASGTGILIFKIAHRFPRCRVIGVELREEYLKIAQGKMRVLKLRNAELETLIQNAKRMLRSGAHVAALFSLDELREFI